MSPKSQFRSEEGCCICGTKSSSSRFTESKRFSKDFQECFNVEGRSGELCNPCVLCVKRWRKKKETTYASVVDSKRGTGPKHMKQILKRQRRQASRDPSTSSRVSGCSTSSHGSSSVGAGSSSTPRGHTRSSTANESARLEDLRSPISPCTPASSLASLHLSSASSGSLSTSGSSGCIFTSEHEFKSPPNPGQGGERGRSAYKKRIKQPPIKMPNTNEEVSQLLRDILDKNSQAINFDGMEMHRAAQKQIRLRSGTVVNRDFNSISSGSFGSSVGNLDTLKKL